MNTNNRHPNAKKWTLEVVTAHLSAIEKDVSVRGSFFLGRALAKRRLYRDIWPYWKKVFADYDDILETMLVIETMLEANITEGALKRELAPNIATLTLKHNYKWRDRPGPEPEPEPEKETKQPVSSEPRPDTNLRYILGGGQEIRVMDLDELKETLAHSKQMEERRKMNGPGAVE